MRLEDAPDLLTVAELAQLLRIGRNAAYQLVRSGRIASLRVGHHIRIPRQAVAAFIRNS